MKEKRKWSQPKIETVELKFDKVMAASCWMSDSTPEMDGICGMRTDAAWNCWNKNSA